MMILRIVKMTLQLLMLLLMKRKVRWRKRAKVILLVMLTTAGALFGRTETIMYACMYVEGMGQKSSPCTATFNDLLCNVNYFLVILNLKTLQ
jgi:hypothetical protein